MAEVTLVVVTHESAHCVPSLDGLLGGCPNVIIVDNGSTDGTPALAQERWPHAQVLALPQNLGFGAANNRALDRVTTPFALLLNPDCELAQGGVLALLQAAEDAPDAALLAPQLSSPTGRLEVNYRWPATTWRASGPAATGLTCVGFVCGAAMLFRMAHFRSVGFFDERFFLYYEDTDLAGIVYYANYLKFIERARTEWVASLGVDQVALKAREGIVFAVRRVEADFLRPARFGDDLVVETTLQALGGARIVLEQVVSRGAERLFVSVVTLVCMSNDGHAARLPVEVRAKLSGPLH